MTDEELVMRLLLLKEVDAEVAAKRIVALRTALDGAEAKRDAAVKFLAEAVDDLKIKESLHTNERGRDCLAFLAAHLGAKP